MIKGFSLEKFERWANLRFDDPEIEKAYEEHSQSENKVRVTFGAKLVCACCVILACVTIVVQSAPTPSWDAIRGHVFRLSFMICVCTALIWTPVRYLERSLCLLEFMVCVMMACAGNAFRLRQLSLIDDVPPIPMNTVWVDCDLDLAVHCRDFFGGLFVLAFQIVSKGVARVRARRSWIAQVLSITIPALLACSPNFRLRDGGGTIILALTVALIACCSWAFKAVLPLKQCITNSLQNLSPVRMDLFKNLLKNLLALQTRSR